MRLSLDAWALVFLLPVGVGACVAQDRPPHADLRADSGRIGIGTSTPRPDASRDGDTEAAVDANAPDAGSFETCDVVSSGSTQNRLTVTEVDSQAQVPFAASRAFARWDDLCVPASLIVGLGEASCTLGVGRQLVFGIAGEAIGTSLMPGGNQVEIAAFEDRIDVWYFDPDAEGGPATRSNCFGSFGSLIIEDIGSEAGSRVTMEFNLNLTDCDMPQSLVPYNLVGNLDVVVPRSNCT